MDEKIVTAQEMARIEAKSLKEGASEELYVDKAGRGIAALFVKHIKDKRITLLVGKGNNGADALSAGVALLDKGFTITAISLFPKEDCAPLCQKYWTAFEKKGGIIRRELRFHGTIVDGLLGTGFHGEPTGQLKEAIDAANSSSYPIIAVDLPSGLNGSTGEVNGAVIKATETFYLGLPKVGCFLGVGWDVVGVLFKVDFGLAQKYIAEMQPVAVLLDEQEIVKALPSIQRTRHKYQTGYLVALAGSPGMPGAALLASLAALRTGAGIVRLFHPPEMENEFGSTVKELVRSIWTRDQVSPLEEEVKRAKALLVGPGLSKNSDALHIAHKLLTSGKPTVVDADALGLLKEIRFPTLSVIATPHRGEMHALLGEEIPNPLKYVEACQAFASLHNLVLVHKGAPTWVFQPNAPPTIVSRGTPALAKAGTGDVLTGIIAALLAQGVDVPRAALLGVYIHAIAGERAANKLSAYSVIASDVIAAIPYVLRDCLSVLSKQRQ